MIPSEAKFRVEIYCIAVGIIQSVLDESPSIELDYSQRSLLSGELEAG